VEDFAPFDARLEQEIIGCMIVDPACIADVADILKPEHFYIDKHRKLCREILRLWNEDEARVSLVEMAPFLQKESITVTEITEMVEGVATTAAIRYHVERLRAIASLRSMVELGREMAASGYVRGREEIRELINRFEQRISSLSEATTQMNTMTDLKDALMRFNERFDLIAQRSGGVTGVPTGFDDLDALTAGYQPQDLIILAGRPSMGKTAFAIQTGLEISGRVEEPVLFFELEMSEDQMVKRMIANVGAIDIHQITMGETSDDFMERFTYAQAELANLPLIIDTQPGISVSEMKAKARRVKRERGLSCIIIDYIGLIPGERGASRYETVSENTRQLKNMARELNVPIIALSQLSRAVEQRQDKRPMLSDLRESGEIEQTADVVMFIYRDDYYNDMSDRKGLTEIIVAKHRNGPTGKAEFLFRKECNRFLPLTRSDKP